MIKILKVKDLPLDDRPREKLLIRGTSSLTDAELLAILIRAGTKGHSAIEIAQKLISEQSDLANVALLSINELKKIKGIGRDKAVTLIAAFEIAKRVQMQNRWEKNTTISSPEDIAEMLIPMLKDEPKEKFLIACLNRANRLIKIEEISVGSLDTSIVHPREVFKAAIENLSASIILIHNHPSGNAVPSEADKKITKQLVNAGTLLDIPVFDHIIIAGNKFFSFVSEKIL